jgi:predicted nucleic acid-binding protein
VTYLLDTNVVSETRRRRPDPAVLRWLDGIDDARLYLSVVVIGEIRTGIERIRVRDPVRSTDLEQWLLSLVGGFDERVLPVDLAVAEAWGRLRADAPLPVADSLLAATALVHGLAVVTRDTRTAERCGVPFVDPWAD